MEKIEHTISLGKMNFAFWRTDNFDELSFAFVTMNSGMMKIIVLLFYLS